MKKTNKKTQWPLLLSSSENEMTDHVVSSDHMAKTAYHDLAFVRTQKS